MVSSSVNSLWNLESLTSNTAKVFGHVTLTPPSRLCYFKGSININTLTFGCAKELSSWYFMAVGMLPGAISFSVLDRSTVPTPTVAGSHFSSPASVD